MLSSLMDMWSSFAPHPALLFYFFVVFPTALAGSPDSLTFDFPAYRLQQYDVASVAYGSRVTMVNSEAVTLGAKTTLRKCAIIDWKQLTSLSAITDVVSDHLSAAIIVVPEKIDRLTSEEKQQLAEIERALTQHSYPIGVYFAPATTHLLQLVDSLKQTQQAQGGSALSAIVDGVVANSYQVVSASTPNPAPLLSHYNVIGRLIGSSGSGQMSNPTVIIVAHHDAFAAAPAMARGSDSNASGVAAALELLRIMGNLYASETTIPKFNTIVVLSSLGQFGYQGTKHWIDTLWTEINAASSTSHGVHFAMCLDGLSAGDGLYMHVSKPPAAGSNTDKFHQHLLRANQRTHNGSKGVTVPVVAKKINLADSMRAWEHERFSMERLPAFTLSSHETSTRSGRRSMTDVGSKATTRNLTDNIQTIAHALMTYMYSMSSSNAAPSADDTRSLSLVRAASVAGWMKRLTKEGRAAQMMTKPKEGVLADLYACVSNNSQIAQLQTVTLSSNDADLVIYSEVEVILSVYSVKPAVFDLLLAGGIGAYLFAVYHVVLNSATIITVVRSVVGNAGADAFYGNGKMNGKLH